MLGRNAKVNMIKSVPLFERCSKQNLQQVASIADEVDLPEGKVLTREGSPGHEFFVLLEGSADVIQGAKRVRKLGAGDFFGEIALVSRIPRTATVTTTSPARALVITAHDFRSLVDRSPAVALQVLEAVAARLPSAIQ
jgi:CRP-like cAMP-binding protein